MSLPPLTQTDMVLDTSVILKWFRQGEVLAGRALGLRTAYLAGQVAISVPTLLAYELANVLRYKTELTVEQVQQAVNSLFDMGLTWTQPTPPMLQRSVEFARTYEITVYDAAFVILAEVLGAEFITADERLVHRLQVVSFVYFLGDIAEDRP